MDTVVVALHVLIAVFIVGPMAILPMTAMRSVRAGDAKQVATLAKSVNLFSLIALLMIVTGMAAVGLAPKEDEVSASTPWVLASLLLTIVAVGLNLALVVPTLRKASAAIASGSTETRYPAIAAGSGVVALVLVVVVILMVWKP